ncbi:hypothetical protein Tco_0787475 [Tanacetum coccineum]
MKVIQRKGAFKRNVENRLRGVYHLNRSALCSLGVDGLKIFDNNKAFALIKRISRLENFGLVLVFLWFVFIDPHYLASEPLDPRTRDVNPFGGGNPLLTKETESEPIIWDTGDEEEEYPFVNKHPSYQEEPIMLEEVVCTDNEEESEVIYDTNWNDVNDFPEFELLHPYQGESLVIQQVLSVAPSKSIDDNSCRRNNIFHTKCTSKYKVCKMIIDGGSCENVVSTYMVEKLAKIIDHPDPYQLIWLRKEKTIKDTKILKDVLICYLDTIEKVIVERAHPKEELRILERDVKERRDNVKRVNELAMQKQETVVNKDGQISKDASKIDNAIPKASHDKDKILRNLQHATERTSTDNKALKEGYALLTKELEEYKERQVVASNPKLHLATSLCDQKVQLHVHDTEDILEDAKESRFKMKEKQKDSEAQKKKVKPIYERMRLWITILQEELTKEVQEMLNVFESMESEVDETSEKYEILHNDLDRLLEATLADDVRNLVMHSCVKIENKNLREEIGNFSKDSRDVSNESKSIDKFCNDAVDVKEKLSKRTVQFEKDFAKLEAKKISFKLRL